MHEKSLAAGAARQTPSRLRRELFYSLLPNHLVAPRHLRSRAFSIASAPAALRSLVLPYQLYKRGAAAGNYSSILYSLRDISRKSRNFYTSPVFTSPVYVNPSEFRDDVLVIKKE